MSENITSSRRTGPRMLAAMVIGTALSTLSPSLASARQSVSASSPAVADLSRYCTACWSNARLPADVWNDCTQEVLCRLLQRVPAEKWPQVLGDEGDERREFVRAIDAVKKREQRRKKWSANALESVADSRESLRRRLDDDRGAVRDVADEVLMSRQ